MNTTNGCSVPAPAAGIGRMHRTCRHNREWSIGVRAIYLSMLILSLWASAAVAARAAEVVGIVEDIKGSSGDYALVRGDAKLQLRICEEIQNGDKIVLPQDGEVRVRMTTDESIVLTERQSGQPIKERGAPASRTSNLLANLAEVITPWHDFVEFNLAVEGPAPKSPAREPLELPLIPKKGAAVAVGAGERSFALAWLGGTPPFKVSIVTAPGGQAVLKRVGVTSRALPLHPLALAASSYTLRLEDAAGHTIERKIEAVPNDKVPQPPLDPGLDGLSHSWGVTARAAWMAQQDKGQWLLEAFLEAAPMSEEFEPAHVLIDLLAKGGPIEPR
jgi:hypothetical protein